MDKKITIPKAFLATILFILLLEIISFITWFPLERIFGFDHTLKYSTLVIGFLEALTVFVFIRGIKTSDRLPQPTRPRWYLLAILLGVSIVFVQIPLNFIYNVISGTNYHIVFDFNCIGKLADVNIISFVILIPLAEELFFREFLQQGLQKRYQAAVAIIVASLLFGAIHLPYEALFLSNWSSSPHVAYITFFVGLTSGILYYKSGSIGPSIVMHITWNLIAHIM